MLAATKDKKYALLKAQKRCMGSAVCAGRKSITALSERALFYLLQFAVFFVRRAPKCCWGNWSRALKQWCLCRSLDFFVSSPTMSKYGCEPEVRTPIWLHNQEALFWVASAWLLSCSIEIARKTFPCFLIPLIELQSGVLWLNAESNYRNENCLCARSWDIILCMQQTLAYQI
jgi:hypothetical protein